MAERPAAHATVFLQAPQDITVGGRLSRGQYQYTLQDANIVIQLWAGRSTILR